MTSARRIGAPDAKNRGVLLDAAEQLMLEEGYAAVTSRRVAERFKVPCISVTGSDVALGEWFFAFPMR